MVDEIIHRSELGYTNSDDGVWLYCTSCRSGEYRLPWQINLGFFPTVDDVVAAWRAHVDG